MTKVIDNPNFATHGVDPTLLEGFLKPNRGRCVLKQDGFSYSGLLAIPERAKIRPTTGTIIAVHPDDDTSWLGRRVVYAQFSGTPIHFKNQAAYVILGVEEILAEVTKTNEELELKEFESLSRE